LTEARTFIAPGNRDRIETRTSAEPRRRLHADRKE
jgi:hypothetical protein